MRLASVLVVEACREKLREQGDNVQRQAMRCGVRQTGAQKTHDEELYRIFCCFDVSPRC